MADKYEFVSAADLPETDGVDCETLCIEGGQLKRKKATSGWEPHRFYLGDYNEDYFGWFVYTDPDKTIMAEYAAVIDLFLLGSARLLGEYTDGSKLIAFAQTPCGEVNKSSSMWYDYGLNGNMMFSDTVFPDTDNASYLKAEDRSHQFGRIITDENAGEVTENEVIPVAD